MGVMRSTLRVLLCVVLAACAADTPETTEDRYAEDTRLEIIRPPVLRPDAMFPETEWGSLIDVEVLEDRLIFHFDATPPTLEPGTVVAGALGGGYLRRVETVTALSGNRLELGTVGATLTELFDDVHFTYVFTPSVDRPGESIPYDSIESTVGARTDAVLINRTPVEVVPGSGIRCRTGGSATLSPFLTFQPRIQVEIDIRKRLLRTPKLEYARFVLGGEVTVGTDVEISAAPSITCTWEADLDAYAASWTTSTPFPGVGVLVLTHKLGPVLEISANWRGPEVTGTFSGSATLNVQVGTEKPRGSDRWVNLSEVGVTGEASLPEVTVAENWAWEVKADGGMKYELRAYDAIGPDFSLTIPVTVSGEGDGTCYTEDVTVGADAHVGVEVKVPVLDYTIASETWDWPVIAEMSLPSWPREAGECADPCGEVTDCGTCATTDNCGWCDGRCVSTSNMDSCSSGFIDNASACEPCEATTCGECTTSGFCVWCPGSGCVNQRSPDYAMLCDPATVQSNPGDCGG